MSTDYVKPVPGGKREPPKSEVPPPGPHPRSPAEARAAVKKAVGKARAAAAKADALEKKKRKAEAEREAREGPGDRGGPGKPSSGTAHPERSVPDGRSRDTSARPERSAADARSAVGGAESKGQKPGALGAGGGGKGGASGMPGGNPPAPAAPPNPFVLAATLKNKADGKPLAGAAYDVVPTGQEPKPVASGKAGEDGRLTAGVPAAGNYTIRVTEAAGARVYPAATGALEAAPRDPAPGPQDVLLDLGIRPRFVWKNDGGKPVKKRHVFLGPEVKCLTDEDGLADVSLTGDMPPFDVIACKPDASYEDTRADLLRVRMGKRAKLIDGLEEKDQVPATKIELRRLHRDRIERALFPHVRDIVPIYNEKQGVDGRDQIDIANCNVCSAITKAILVGIGYDGARVNDCGQHVSVWVTPPGEEELVIDISMPQFLRNGTAIDSEMKERGGFIGTIPELVAFARRHAIDSNFQHAPFEPWEMVRARELITYRAAAERAVDGAKAAGKKDEAAERLLAEASAKLAGALAFEARIGGSDDVYGPKETFWRRYSAEAKNPDAQPAWDRSTLDRLKKPIEERLGELQAIWKLMIVGDVALKFPQGDVVRFAGVEPLEPEQWGVGRGRDRDGDEFGGAPPTVDGCGLLCLFRRSEELGGVGTTANDGAARYAAWARNPTPHAGYEAIRKAIEREE
ncbi:MAG TPA: hypothetical protein VHF22_07355 [Planctomycetota bacterium]|nr:hypothetical protein [Planctomycetota bacterium]